MMIIGHGEARFSAASLLATSRGRPWSGNVLAELRSHRAGSSPSFVPIFTEVAMLVRGQTILTRQSGKVLQRTEATSGTLWLTPAGQREDFFALSEDVEEILHLYFSPHPFLALADCVPLKVATASLRYEAGFRDPLVEQIALAIVQEMRQQTSCGMALVGGLVSALLARLLHRYSDLRSDAPAEDVANKELDKRRLRRTLEFVEERIEEPITIEELARVASLSRFYFARAFKAAIGKSPRDYISERRLTLAKTFLAQEDRSIAEIAFACNYSSQANFAKAFRKFTGATPSQYRKLVRGG
jgi:AraC family transcriptional regulator